MKEGETKKVVREGYGKIAQKDLCCHGPATFCCASQELVRDIRDAPLYGGQIESRTLWVRILYKVRWWVVGQSERDEYS